MHIIIQHLTAEVSVLDSRITTRMKLHRSQVVGLGAQAWFCYSYGGQMHSESRPVHYKQFIMILFYTTFVDIKHYEAHYRNVHTNQEEVQNVD